jgi:hypothetical protein
MRAVIGSLLLGALFLGGCAEEVQSYNKVVTITKVKLDYRQATLYGIDVSDRNVEIHCGQGARTSFDTFEFGKAYTFKAFQVEGREHILCADR